MREAEKDYADVIINYEKRRKIKKLQEDEKIIIKEINNN